MEEKSPAARARQVSHLRQGSSPVLPGGNTGDSPVKTFDIEAGITGLNPRGMDRPNAPVRTLHAMTVPWVQGQHGDSVPI
jgi:hypothetical protein